MAESGEDLEDGYFELPEYDEEGLIRYYFFRGFEYKEIRLFLLKNHGTEMSLWLRQFQARPSPPPGHLSRILQLFPSWGGAFAITGQLGGGALSKATLLFI